jgi:hypothetical protein
MLSRKAPKSKKPVQFRTGLLAVRLGDSNPQPFGPQLEVRTIYYVQRAKCASFLQVF